MLIEDLNKLGRSSIVAKKTLLFSAGEQANGFYYISSGEIRLYKMSASGKEIEVNRLKSGDFFGEVILFSSEKFPVYAETIKDSKVIFFAKNIILSELTRNTNLANFFIKLLFLMPYKDTQCGAKIFKRQAIEKVVSSLEITKWAFDVELLYKLRKAGFRIKEVPTTWSDKEYSKINFMKAGPKMLLAIVRLRLVNSWLRFVVKIYDRINLFRINRRKK